MGLLDFIKTPEGQGIASAIAGYAMNARKGTPINNLGRGAMSGVIGYANAQDQLNQNEQAAQMKQLRGLQIDQMNRQLELNKRLGAALQNGYGADGNVTQSLSGGEGPTIANAAKLTGMNESMPSKANLSPAQALAQAAREAGDYDAYAKAQAMLVEEKKLAPKYSTDVRIVSINGVPTPVQMADDGSWKVMGQNVSPAEKLNFQNIGNRVVGLNPYTGQEASSIRTTMSPDAIASNNLGWANYYKPQFNADAGGFVVPPTKTNPTGSVIPVPGMNKPLNGEQAKAAGFSDRMVAAENILSNPKIAGGQMPNSVEGLAGSLPMVGNYLSNVARNPIRQQYRQAQEDWVRAKLRKESGAAIGADEMEKEISQYFPTHGDSEEVIAQKAASRRQALEALSKETGSYQTKQVSKPSSKAFKLDGGGSVIGKLGEDGNYYVTRNGKKFKVEE